MGWSLADGRSLGWVFKGYSSSLFQSRCLVCCDVSPVIHIHSHGALFTGADWNPSESKKPFLLKLVCQVFESVYNEETDVTTNTPGRCLHANTQEWYLHTNTPGRCLYASAPGRRPQEAAWIRILKKISHALSFSLFWKCLINKPPPPRGQPHTNLPTGPQMWQQDHCPAFYSLGSAICLLGDPYEPP